MAKHFSFTNMNARASAMIELQRKFEVNKTRSKTEKERCLSGQRLMSLLQVTNVQFPALTSNG